MTDIKKALSAADQILKGEASDLSADDFEKAMFAHADSRARDGESAPQAFGRLVAENDETISKLWAAMDTARVQQVHADVLRKRAERPVVLDLMKSAEDRLDELAKAEAERRDIPFEQAYADVRDTEQGREAFRQSRAARDRL